MQTGLVIYEDNDPLRDSLCKLITYSPELLLLGSFSTAVDVVQQVQELHPDVILMDIDMPGISGIDAVKRIRSFNRQLHIIMLTIFEDHQHVLDAICAGASGYLLKKYISDQLQTAIQQVMKNEAPMSPGIARMVIQKLYQQSNQAIPNTYDLSVREKEILTSLSSGNSYKMISAELSISIDTVRTHIKHIYQKLEVHSQTEAVAKAMNERLV